MPLPSASKKVFSQTLLPPAATQGAAPYPHSVLAATCTPGRHKSLWQNYSQSNLLDSDLEDKKMILLIYICNSILIFYMKKKSYSVVKWWWLQRSNKEPLMLILLVSFQLRSEPWTLPREEFRAGHHLLPQLMLLLIPLRHRTTMDLTHFEVAPKLLSNWGAQILFHQLRKPHWTEPSLHRRRKLGLDELQDR